MPRTTAKGGTHEEEQCHPSLGSQRAGACRSPLPLYRWQRHWPPPRFRAEYPAKIIKIVVPFSSGGGTDIIARTLAQEISSDLGKPVIIENKPGAGTVIGTQTVAASEPDGYTLLLASFAHAVNPSLNSKLPFDPHKDFAAVSLIARSINIVVVNPASNIKIDLRPDRGSQGQTREAQLRHVRDRDFGPSGRGTVQSHGECEPDDGVLQGRCAGDHRSSGRPDRCHFYNGGERSLPYRRRATPGIGCHLCRAFAGISRFADRRRGRGAGLRRRESGTDCTRRPGRLRRSSSV